MRRLEKMVVLKTDVLSGFWHAVSLSVLNTTMPSPIRFYERPACGGRESLSR